MTRVLIADDEPDSLRLLELSLRRLGCDVVSVTSGDAAWEALSAPDAPTLAFVNPADGTAASFIKTQSY